MTDSDISSILTGDTISKEDLSSVITELMTRIAGNDSDITALQGVDSDYNVRLNTLEGV